MLGAVIWELFHSAFADVDVISGLLTETGLTSFSSLNFIILLGCVRPTILFTERRDRIMSQIIDSTLPHNQSFKICQ